MTWNYLQVDFDCRINFEQVDADFYLCPNKAVLTNQVDSKIQPFLDGQITMNENGEQEISAKRLTQIMSTGPTIPGGNVSFICCMTVVPRWHFQFDAVPLGASQIASTSIYRNRHLEDC